MKLYFSGFSLKDEQQLFKDYIKENDFTVSGFSYGAIKAFEYTLQTEKRIDLLQLFSPAFFHDKDTKYKRMQLMFFNKNSSQYCDSFLTNCGFDKNEVHKYFKEGSVEELEKLLNYVWDEDKLQKIIEKNIRIEVYLGSDDKIINSHEALEFFKKFCEVYYIKNKGHIL
jgi:hypothetical protein